VAGPVEVHQPLLWTPWRVAFRLGQSAMEFASTFAAQYLPAWERVELNCRKMSCPERWTRSDGLESWTHSDGLESWTHCHGLESWNGRWTRSDGPLATHRRAGLVGQFAVTDSQCWGPVGDFWLAILILYPYIFVSCFQRRKEFVLARKFLLPRSDLCIRDFC
jgi:hypothetical protein